MPIIARVKDGIAVLRVSGNLMGGRKTGSLITKVKSYIEKDIHWIIVDLGEVPWLNSNGIGTLVSCMMSCRNAGGDLVVSRAAKKVKSLLAITEVIKLLDAYPSIKEAKSALQARMTG